MPHGSSEQAAHKLGEVMPVARALKDRPQFMAQSEQAQQGQEPVEPLLAGRSFRSRQARDSRGGGGRRAGGRRRPFPRGHLRLAQRFKISPVWPAD